jgi:hypothetical protein
MPKSITETLNNIIKLRNVAQKQLQEGKKPDVAPGAFDLMEKMIRNINGDYSHGRTSIQEGLTSTDVVQLIPKVIEGQLREAAEPEYLATRFMNTIHVDGGNSAVYVIPVVGELFAHEVGEGTRYREESVDFNTVENGQLEVRVKKIGLKVKITEEAITDSSWDIYGINVRKMGQAMGRYKEEWCFNSFSDHGTVVFDNNLRAQMPEAGTQGRAADGSLNDTMTVEDFLDLVLGLMGNDMTPTDIIMHPLTWVIFARNSMIGNGLTYGAFGASQVHPWGATQGTPGFAGLQADEGPQKLIMTPDQVQNRLPMPMQINFSPFVHFDKVNKKFDMYCIDRSNVGVIVEKEGLSTDNWTDPERDMRLLKCKERYGVGITNNGRGITVARNLAVAPTYPVAPTVNVNLPIAGATATGQASITGGSTNTPKA